MLTKPKSEYAPVIPELLPNDRFRKAYRFWFDHKAGDLLPHASVINPVRIPRDLLPNISIIAVEKGAKRFFVRLVGTGIVHGVGRDLTGKWGEDVEGGAEVVKRYAICVERRAPVFHEGPHVWPHIDYKHHRVLILPFADSAGEVSRVLGYVEYQ
jgi:hypothetical protein